MAKKRKHSKNSKHSKQRRQKNITLQPLQPLQPLQKGMAFLTKAEGGRLFGGGSGKFDEARHALVIEGESFVGWFTLCKYCC
jgi:hypothetical protein